MLDHEKGDTCTLGFHLVMRDFFEGISISIADYSLINLKDVARALLTGKGSFNGG